jgi:integrase
MDVEDYHPKGKRWWVRLHTKKAVSVTRCRPTIISRRISTPISRRPAFVTRRKGPLFRSAHGRTGMLTGNRMHRVDAWRMVQRHAAAAGLLVHAGNHSFRATGITAYLNAGGTLENARAMAAHESPRTTKLYDRTSDEVTLDEVERIAI